MKISQLKWNLQTIITSLNNLEKLRENHKENRNSLSSEIAACKEQLEISFANLENESLGQLVSQLNKRKSKRHTKKLKTKKHIGHKKNRGSIKASTIVPSVPEKTCNTLQSCQLRSSKKYITFIESLEKLHQLKDGGDSCKLKESLKSIKSIWQSTQHDIKKKIIHNSLKDMWDTVLFGEKTEIEIVPDLPSFLDRRFTWDTYIDSSNGSHIPIGWVYPKDDARPEWKQFLQLT